MFSNFSAVDEISLKESRAYDYVLSVLATYPTVPDIQSGGLLVLASLLEMDSYAASSLALQGQYVTFIIDSVRRLSDNTGVVAHGCKCLRTIIKYVCTYINASTYIIICNV